MNVLLRDSVSKVSQDHTYESETKADLVKPPRFSSLPCLPRRQPDLEPQKNTCRTSNPDDRLFHKQLNDSRCEVSEGRLGGRVESSPKIVEVNIFCLALSTIRSSKIRRRTLRATTLDVNHNRRPPWSPPSSPLHQMRPPISFPQRRRPALTAWNIVCSSERTSESVVGRPGGGRRSQDACTSSQDGEVPASLRRQRVSRRCARASSIGRR